MATFQRSPQETADQVAKVIREHYPELQDLAETRGGLRFDLLDVFADLDANGEPVGHPLTSKGRIVSADIRAVSKADRALGRGDVLIRFDADNWKNLDTEEREALIDHELCHLIVLKDEGVPKMDDLGRPRFKLREHDYDFGWFVEVAKRRGLKSPEVKQARRIWVENGQILFNFQAEFDLKPGKGGPELHVLDGGLPEPKEDHGPVEVVPPEEREALEEAELAAGGGPGRPPEVREKAKRAVRGSRKAASSK